MKIAHVIWSFNVGGAELMLIDIVNEQVLTDEVAIFIVNNFYEPEVLKYINDKVEVKFIGRPPASKNVWYLFKLLMLLKIFGTQVIHSHEQNLISILRVLSIPKLLTVHDTNIDLIPAVKNYSKIISISLSVKNDLHKRYPEISSSVIYNGIHIPTRAQKKITKLEKYHIVQVGRLQHLKKGQDILLRAVAYLKKHYLVDVTVDFIGEGPSRVYLEDLTADLGMNNACRFLGKRPREYIYENLNSYDLLVQPSRNEGFGLTVVEAMVTEVPVLVSNIEGPMEIIENGKYGYFFKNGDEVDCAKAVYEIIKASYEDDFKFKQNEISKHIIKKFDIKNTAKNYLEEYKRLIDMNY